MLTTSYVSEMSDNKVPFDVFAKKYVELSKESDRPLLKYISAATGEQLILSLHEYHKLVDSLGYSFYSVVGIKRKDVVGIYLPNCYQFMVCEGAVETCGFIMMPFNPGYKSDQLERLFKRGDVKLVITVKALLPNVISADKSVKIVVVDAVQEELTSFISEGIQIYSYFELIKTPLNSEFLENERNQIQAEDILFYGCTSGSTGEPKICVYTNRAFIGNITSNEAFVPGNQRRTCCFVPLFTTTGHLIIAAVIVKGFYYIFLDKFDVEKIFQIVEEDKITSIGGAPPAFLAMLKHPNRKNYNLSSLREFTVGGAVASNEFMETLKQTFNLEVASSGFGMTETCGIVYKMPAKSTGIPCVLTKNYEIRIVDHETREVLPISLAGELEIRSPFILKEYLNNPDANKQAFTEDRWFRTGDEAVLESDKFLRITGRVKDMIIRGGHNIWPAEICDIMIKHPKIQEAAVIGIPDKVQGESVVSFVVVKKGCEFEDLEKELKTYLSDKLVPFSIPTYIFELSDMPRTSFGKVYAPKLKEIVKGLIENRWEKLIKENDDKPITEGGKDVAKIWAEFFDVPVDSLSRKSNFYSLGGDSFVGAQTVAVVRKYVPSTPFNLVSMKPTLGEIEDYIERPTLSSNENEELNKDLEWIKHANTHEIFGNSEKETINENKERKCAIITGATGYLGVYLTNELCKKTDIEKVYCVGRSSNKNELIKKMRLMQRMTEMEWNNKIEIVVGDVAKENFGIDEAKANEMKENSKYLVHCAAVVNWTKTYGQLKGINAFGVLNSIKFAGKQMNICYISTIGSALNGNETISDRIPLQSFGYIQSKWMGEQICKRAIEDGFKISIMRPSFIVADSKTGVCNTDDFIYKMLRISVKNSIGMSDSNFMMTPADKVAECIVNNLNRDNVIINLIPNQPVSSSTLFTVCNNLGNTVQIVDSNQWKMKITELAQKGDREAMQLLASLGVIDSKGNIQSEFFKSNPAENILDFTEISIENNIKKLQSAGFFKEEGCSLMSRCK